MSAPRCIDCAHARFSRFLWFVDRSYPRCAKFTRLDPVQGVVKLEFCSSLRGGGERCGPEANSFASANVESAR